MQNKKLTLEQIADLDRKKFIKQFISRMKGKSLEEIAEYVWKYGSDEWSKGYGLGVRGYKNETK